MRLPSCENTIPVAVVHFVVKSNSPQCPVLRSCEDTTPTLLKEHEKHPMSCSKQVSKSTCPYAHCFRKKRAFKKQGLLNIGLRANMAECTVFTRKPGGSGDAGHGRNMTKHFWRCCACKTSSFSRFLRCKQNCHVQICQGAASAAK